MLAFLSPAWIDALDAAATSDPALAAATDQLTLVVEQEVLDGPDGDVTFHVAFDHGVVRVAAGPAHTDDDAGESGQAPPTVRFSQGYATARAIALGTESAQRAFMSGSLQVGGDLRVLLDHQATLAALDDVFAGVRARTDLGPAIGSDAVGD